LNFYVCPLPVYPHIDVKAAEFFAHHIRRHFGIGYYKFLNAFKPYAKYLRDKPFSNSGYWTKAILNSVSFLNVYSSLITGTLPRSLIVPPPIADYNRIFESA
jgi:hypothetical protein